MKPTRTLFMLASKKDLRFLENDGVGKGLHQIADHKISEGEGRPKGFADAAGQQQSAPGIGGHSFERPTPPADVERDFTAREAVVQLQKIWAGGRFSRIILTAEPQLLGELRKHISPTLRPAVYGELAKDLARVPTNDLPRHFADVIDL